MTDNVTLKGVAAASPAQNGSAPDHRIATISLIIFSLPMIPTVLLLGPLGAILPTYYTAHTTVTLAAMGTVLLASRLVDAVSDPLIGYLSDRTRSPLGRRKPWIIAGTIMAMACAHELFVPPASAGWPYFLACSLLGYLAYSMIFIPYNAWTSELSGEYHERSRVFAVRNVVGGIGGIGFALGPLLLSPLTGSTAINAKTLDLLAWGIIILMPLAVGLASWRAPDGQVIAAKPSSVRQLMGAMRVNRPLWTFLGTVLLSGLANGANLSLSYMVIDHHFHLANHISELMGATILPSMGSVPVWLWLTRRFGKHRPWAVSMILNLSLMPLLMILKPGQSSFLPLLAIYAVMGVMGGATLVVPAAILSDIIDYDVLKSGVNRAGNYFSFLIFLSKVEAAVGGALAFFLIDAFGYNPKGANGSFATFGLLFAFAGAPSLLWALSGLFAWKYPIDARRQHIIRRRIEQRAAREVIAGVP